MSPGGNSQQNSRQSRPDGPNSIFRLSPPALPFTLEEPAAPPIVVLGEARSGTTLLRYLLDSHSEICGPGEDQLIDSVRGIADFVRTILGYRCPVPPGPDPAPLWGALATRRLIGGLINACVRQNGKKVYCSKTAFSRSFDGAWGVDLYDQFFPETRYICLFRNCRDVVASSIARQKFGPSLFYKRYYLQATRDQSRDLLRRSIDLEYNFITALAESWIDKNRKILDFARQRPDRCISVRYEDLVRQTRTQLRRLFRFLGLPPHDAAMQDAVRTFRPGNQDPKAVVSTAIEDRTGKGRALPAEFITEAQRSAIDELERRMGYRKAGRETETLSRVANRAAAKEVVAFFLRRLPESAKAHAAALNGRRALLQFIVHDAGQGIWWVKVDGPKTRVSRAAARQRPDSVVELSGDTLLSILDGNIDLGLAIADHHEVRIQGRPCVEILKWLLAPQLRGRLQ